MKRAQYETCAYCPKLCRHVCPVAVGTARESTTPTAMMTGALLALDGIVTPAEGYASAALCTSCGACTEVCLLDQPSIRDPKVTIGQVVQAAIAKMGENIAIPRFVRYKLGETN